MYATRSIYLHKANLKPWAEFQAPVDDVPVRLFMFPRLGPNCYLRQMLFYDNSPTNKHFVFLLTNSVFLLQPTGYNCKWKGLPAGGSFVPNENVASFDLGMI